ncbi:putative nuclease HARBI1 [Episyrphus balteatus]|uniref:putative nuclease HARBI1 n=1 Tax=Episyrphus balteatus TaxID=286459 RepID=UPI002485E885|nr:putative nuclease HARBI1 [Episyrphus balteatus]
MDVDLVDLVLIQELVTSSSSSSSSSTSSSSSSSSSSSFSSDKSFSDTFSDDDFFQLHQLFEKNERQSVKNFVDDVVDDYTDEEFLQHFRVSRKTAKYLTEEFAKSKHLRQRIKCGGRKPISAKIQCLSFLWFAGNKYTYREVAQLFNLSLSSAYRHQTSFLEFLMGISKQHIKMPETNEEKEAISYKFAQIAGMPNVLGCIDGCCIYIRTPARNDKSTFQNAQGDFSITLQSICDADKKFLDVFVGASSKLHNSQIYEMSEVSKEIPRICSQQYHILGDGAYPLREFLLTPYRELEYGELSFQQRLFNEAHHQTRLKIKDSFSLLKARFRQLSHLDFFTVSRMSKFVLGCCVLHNLCLENGDLLIEEIENDKPAENNTFEENLNEPEPCKDQQTVLDSVLLHKGQIKRNNITATM